jgi:hypothetical protein
MGRVDKGLRATWMALTWMAFTRCVLAGLLGFTLGMAGPGGAMCSAQERPELTGTWKLNNELTTKPGQQLSGERDAGGRRSPVGASGSPMGGGRGPTAMGGGYAGPRQNPEEMAKAREAIRLAMLTPERLTILGDSRGFVVTDEDGVSQKWSPDGKTTTSQSGALTVETKIKWDADLLVIERKFEGDVKVTDRYSVRSNPRQLVIASKIENKNAAGERSRTFQRVYDALER